MRGSYPERDFFVNTIILFIIVAIIVAFGAIKFINEIL